jgi:carboxylesterase
MPEMQKEKKLRKYGRRSGWVLFLILACAVLFQSCLMDRRIKKEIADYPRDPLTGVIEGTEAVTLRPERLEGPTSRTACLLIHGFLSSRKDYNDLGEKLVQEGMTVRLMRLPGHGTTEPDFAYQPDGALYKAVETEYKQLRQEFDRVYVAGFSMGGTLSTLLASREKVDRLVLIAPYYRVSYEWYYLLPAEAWQPLLSWAFPYLPRSDVFVKIKDRDQIGKFFIYHTLTTSGARQLLALGHMVRQPEVLQKVACPVLMVHSPHDGAANPKAAEEAFNTFSSTDKQIVWFNNSDHMLLWDYDREEVKRTLLDFLKK